MPPEEHRVAPSGTDVAATVRATGLAQGLTSNAKESQRRTSQAGKMKAAWPSKGSVWAFWNRKV
jgi:hypothetical protein